MCVGGRRMAAVERSIMHGGWVCVKVCEGVSRREV
jgi:hypothetical protein